MMATLTALEFQGPLWTLYPGFRIPEISQVSFPSTNGGWCIWWSSFSRLIAETIFGCSVVHHLMFDENDPQTSGFGVATKKCKPLQSICEPWTCLHELFPWRQSAVFPGQTCPTPKRLPEVNQCIATENKLNSGVQYYGKTEILHGFSLTQTSINL